jgi:hypothetical protein
MLISLADGRGAGTTKAFPTGRPWTTSERRKPVQRPPMREELRKGRALDRDAMSSPSVTVTTM